MDQMKEVQQGLVELFDAAKALKEAVERAKPILEAIEARWGARSRRS